MGNENADICREIEYYNGLPCVFEDFIDMEHELSDGVISLACRERHPENAEKKFVPAYMFDICVGDEKVGVVNLRVGYTEGLYYAGQIGYAVEEAHRGWGYAVRACRLAARLARAHGMTKLIISNDKDNRASVRVCEKLGARLVRTAPLPEWHDLYGMGQRFTRACLHQTPGLNNKSK